jgi:hypothetical protein
MARNQPSHGFRLIGLELAKVSGRALLEVATTLS